MSRNRSITRIVRFAAFAALAITLAQLSAAEPGADQLGKKKESTSATNTERPGWRLVWSDEFDYEGLPDPKKWKYETGFVRNHELQYYTEGRSENARVENGMLVIEARKEHFPNPKYDKTAAKGDWNKTHEFAEYTAASLNTASTASWTYGRVEVRAKLPKGKGTWPAIWMLGKKGGWPKCGEIDIMENVGFDPDGIHTTIHTAQVSNHAKHTAKGHRTTVPHPYDDFHVYAVEWTEKVITFFVDENKVFAFENNSTAEDAWPFDKPQYLLLNFAFGGEWGGAKGVDETIFPQKFFIDYVRVYEAAEKAVKP